MAKYAPFNVQLAKDGDGHRLVFKGAITEEAKPQLMSLLSGPQGKVVLDMGAVTFINSCGVRDWSFFLKAFREGREVVFDKVTDEIVRTMNMVANFHARLPIKSLYRAYACDACGKEHTVHFSEGKDYHQGAVPQLETRRCACGAEAAAIEPDDEFFQFLVA